MSACPFTEEVSYGIHGERHCVLSCGFWLCMGLSTAALAENADPAPTRLIGGKGGQEPGEKHIIDKMSVGHSHVGKTIEGEVFAR